MRLNFHHTSWLMVLILCLGQLQAQPPGHDFLHSRYDALHASPQQQKFRDLAPVPAGVVYIQHPGEGEEEIRWHFRKMKELGFTSLKQIMTVPGWTLEEVQLIALEEGLWPWWYGEGGWDPITPELVKELGLSKKLSSYELRRHPKMIEYQTEFLRERVKRKQAYRQEHDGQLVKGGGGAYHPLVGKRGLDLSEEGKTLFVQWARDTYGDIDTLNFAWNQHHHGLSVKGGAFSSWEDFDSRWQQYNNREYRARRDIMRFKADYGVADLKKRSQAHWEWEPGEPVRAGGELGLFRPHAWFCVDFSGIADAMQYAGSLYPSIHFSWHFDQVEDELTRSLYMQTSYINDMFKGGWTGGWETTGGPQQFDGEKFANPNRGFTVDAGEMQQFTLSMLAGGFKGWGLWCWSVRSAGKEGGEYALLDHHNEVTDRAIAVGKIAQGMQRYREEIWDAHKEPLVGVLFDWDNEAVWAAMSHRQRDSFRFRPMEARVGTARALINANVPWEFVTNHDLKDGLAARYPILYLSGIIALNRELQPILKEYVEQGGRLVIDMPGAWYDTYTALLPRGTGSIFAETFGTVLREYQYAGINRDWELEGQDLLGSIGVLRPEGSEVIAHFENGKPAVTEYQLGQGSAVIIGYEAGRACFKPGNTEMEALLRKYVLGNLKPAFTCDGAIVYRLASPEADHYFVINDGPATQVKLDFEHYEYQGVKDVAEDQDLELGDWLPLEAHSARWLRFEK
jgi:beta-galactosidase